MDVRDALKTYTGKKHIYFTSRGDEAIKAALEHAKAEGKTKVLIPQEGGWLSYQKLPKQLSMELIEIKTRNAILDLTYLKEQLGRDAVLLVNSMPAYSAFEQMELISGICDRYGAMIINDVSGSIGTIHARYGDIMVGSFGKWKPIELGRGGFIAANEFIPLDEAEPDELALAKAIKQRPDRTKWWQEQVKKIKHDLRDLAIVHPGQKGYVAIIKYKSEAEKHHIIQYCESKGWNYRQCPRYIRLQQPAISIEVKQHDKGE